jgi:hypothetical protein
MTGQLSTDFVCQKFPNVLHLCFTTPIEVNAKRIANEQ